MRAALLLSAVISIVLIYVAAYIATGLAGMPH